MLTFYNIADHYREMFIASGFEAEMSAVRNAFASGGFRAAQAQITDAYMDKLPAIAATSIARQIGLPGRIVDILEGESLINDATGLLALEFAIGILVHKRIPTVSSGLLTLVWLTAAALAKHLPAAAPKATLDRCHAVYGGWRTVTRSRQPPGRRA